jgi:hypothetical protein
MAEELVLPFPTSPTIESGALTPASLSLYPTSAGFEVTSPCHRSVVGF